MASMLLIAALSQDGYILSMAGLELVKKWFHSSYVEKVQDAPQA